MTLFKIHTNVYFYPQETLGENICMSKFKPNPTAKKPFSACALQLKVFFQAINAFTGTEKEGKGGIQ